MRIIRTDTGYSAQIPKKNNIGKSVVCFAPLVAT
eukprot:gene10655-7402_t